MKDIAKLIKEIAENNPKKLNGFKFTQFHNSSDDPNYTYCTIKLLPNGRFCIEERSPMDEIDSERKTVHYGDGRVYIDNPLLEQIEINAENLFGRKNYKKYEVHEKSGYDANMLAEFFSDNKITLSSKLD